MYSRESPDSTSSPWWLYSELHICTVEEPRNIVNETGSEESQLAEWLLRPLGICTRTYEAVEIRTIWLPSYSMYWVSCSIRRK